MCVCIRLFEPFDSAISEHYPEGRICPFRVNRLSIFYGET